MQVDERLTWYEMTPGRRNASGDLVQPTTGLIFVPGARVDPRAYAHILRPLAAAGYLVVVLREPLNFALPNSSHADSVLSVHPKIRYWAVGGHSLGGVNAASYADRDPRIDGLLFYASYPASALNRTDLKVTSISGDRDGLDHAGDIAEAKPKLPVRTKYVVIKGGVPLLLRRLRRATRATACRPSTAEPPRRRSARTPGPCWRRCRRRRRSADLRAHRAGSDALP